MRLCRLMKIAALAKATVTKPGKDSDAKMRNDLRSAEETPGNLLATKDDWCASVGSLGQEA